MLLSSDELSGDPLAVFPRAGWDLTPAGACSGPVCIPLADASTVESIASQLGMPIVSDGGGLTALGPASVSGRALQSAEAPNLELPLAGGDGVWRLAAQRGRRTVVIAWAPW